MGNNPRQVDSVYTNRFDVDLGEVTDGRPLFPEKLFIGQHDNRAQLAGAKVGRS